MFTVPESTDSSSQGTSQGTSVITAHVQSSPRVRLASEVCKALRESTPAPHSDSQRAVIQAVENSDVRLVLTGHQAGLFGGPLFTLSKVVSLIAALSEIRNLDRSSPIVPIFWVQSEDHDLQEIDSCNYPRSQGDIAQLSVFNGTDQIKANRTAVNDLLLSSEIAAVLERLRTDLHFYPFASQVLEAASKHYIPGQSWVDSFTGFLNELCRDLGILFFNPRTHATIPLAKQVYRKAFEQRAAISATLIAQQQEWKNTGESVQVAIREHSPLFFLTIKGERYRLLETEHTFDLIGLDSTLQADELQAKSQFTESDLALLVESNPERFTSSALLRPLIQEHLFPHALYLGGPGEIRYFEQVRSIEQLFAIKTPTIIARASFRVIEPKIAEIREQLGIGFDEILKDSESSHIKVAELQGLVTGAQIQNRIRDEQIPTWDFIRNEFEKVDQTLLSPLEKTRAKFEQQLASLLERYDLAMMKNDAVLAARFERVKLHLLPFGKEQERYYSAIYYLCRYGPKLFEQMLQSARLGALEASEINLLSV